MAGYTVQRFDNPTTWRIVKDLQDPNAREELFLRVQGILTETELPPVEPNRLGYASYFSVINTDVKHKSPSSQATSASTPTGWNYRSRYTSGTVVHQQVAGHIPIFKQSPAQRPHGKVVAIGIPRIYSTRRSCEIFHCG